MERSIAIPLPQVVYDLEVYTREEFILSLRTLGASDAGTGEESGETTSPSGSVKRVDDFVDELLW